MNRENGITGSVTKQSAEWGGDIRGAMRQPGYEFQEVEPALHRCRENALSLFAAKVSCSQGIDPMLDGPIPLRTPAC
jgi:hypothetical protein